MKASLTKVLPLVCVGIVSSAITTVVTGHTPFFLGGHGSGPLDGDPQFIRLGPDRETIEEEWRKAREEFENKDQGTRVSLNSELEWVTDANFRAQSPRVANAVQQLQKILAEADPEPASREPSFEWIQKRGIPNIRRTGWYAAIMTAEEDLEGVKLQVKVSPFLVGYGAVTMTNDYAVETYHLGDQGLQYLGTENTPPNFPKMLFGD